MKKLTDLSMVYLTVDAMRKHAEERREASYHDPSINQNQAIGEEIAYCKVCRYLENLIRELGIEEAKAAGIPLTESLAKMEKKDV